jgi:hypothetical protein
MPPEQGERPTSAEVVTDVEKMFGESQPKGQCGSSAKLFPKVQRGREKEREAPFK